MRCFIWCLLLGFLTPPVLTQAQVQGQVLVFVQPGRSISKDFIRNDLPQLKSIAKSEGVSLKVVDATKGAPADVTLTPSVFFEKNGKHTQYEGRYSDVDALEKFIEKGGKTAPADAPKREGVMVWKTGRTTLAAQCEMHPLEGKAKGFDEAKAWKALMDGMAFFRKCNPSSLPASARHFYLEFFPEKTSDGLILIQMELYSEFDMDTPVFRSEMPSGSEWKEWEKAFKKAGKRLETMTLAQLTSNENGDGFEFVKNTIPVVSWESVAARQPMTSKGLVANKTGK